MGGRQQVVLVGPQGSRRSKDGGPSSGKRAARGFTLLEVMLAMGLLAFVLGAVLSMQGTALIHGSRVYNVSMAANAMHSIVLDIEEEFRLEPFSENSVEGRSCELPDGYDAFECEYDLLALEVGSDNVEGTNEAAESINDNPLMAAVCGSLGMSAPGSGGGPPPDMSGVMDQLGGNAVAVAALGQLLDPTSGFAQMCGVNIQRMCMNVQMIGSFIPRIVEQAAKTTRKLVVRLTWKERAGSEKVFTVETFITSVAAQEEGGGGGIL